MTTFEHWQEVASKAGLTGKEILDFANQQMEIIHNRERDERNAERAARKEEEERKAAEREAERAAAEREAERAAAEREAERAAAEREKERATAEREKEREAERQLQLEKFRMELEFKSKTESKPSVAEDDKYTRYKPRLPYISQVEDVYVYLLRFEQSMNSANIPITQWSSRLRDLLTGQILRVYENLPPESQKDYQIMKESLLQSLNLNTEFFRRQFNTMSPPLSTSFGDYANNLKAILSRWMNLASVSTFESLVDMVLKNKILQSCNKDLCAFLIERDPKTFRDLTLLGDQYMAAHPLTQVQDTHSLPVFPAGSSQTPQTLQNPQTNQASRGRPNYKKKAFNRSTSAGPEFINKKPQWQTPRPLVVNPACTICGSEKHMFFSCPYKQQGPDNDPDSSKGIRKLPPNIKCFNCGGNHLRRFCPTWQQGIANSCNITHKQTRNNRKVEIEVKPQIIHPTISDSLPTPITIKLHKAFVNNKLCSMLVDSGANVIGLRSSLIPKSHFTGRFVKCQTFAGNIETYELARVHLRTPQFTGYAEVCSLRNPTADLILGQLSKVIPKSEEEIQEWYIQNGIRYAGTVTTRAQTRLHQQTLEREQTNFPLLNTQSTKREVERNSLLPTIMEENCSYSQSDTTDMNNSIYHNAQDIITTQPTENLYTTTLFEKESEQGMKNTSFSELQKEDPTLKTCFKNAQKCDYKFSKSAKWKFYIKEDVLFREYTNKIRTFKQIVIPSKYRSDILAKSHDSIFAGHMGIQKTLSRLTPYFFWPGITSEVKRYIRSCSICQKMIRKGNVKKAPIQETLLAYTPFEKISLDLVGPLIPSDRGHRYILTCMDHCTRYPIAIPLKYVTTEHITEALVQIFSIFGFPNTILTDHGVQFVSHDMKKFTDLLTIAQCFSSIYHPQSNGLIERFHKGLKEMISKTTIQHPQDWDRVLPCCLFAYREITQSTTGYSPNELLFGTQLRGPISLFYEQCVNPTSSSTYKPYSTFVKETRDRIIQGCQIARENIQEAGQKQRNWANQNRKLITLQPNTQVLVLLPDESNTLLTTWQGPYKIVKSISTVDYVVKVKNNEKVFHINMLKPFHTRDIIKQNTTETGKQTQDTVDSHTTIINSDTETVAASCLSIINDTDEAIEDYREFPVPTLKQTETWKDVHISDQIPQEYKYKFQRLLETYSGILTNIPGETDRIEHEIILTHQTPIKVKQYHLPLHYEEDIKKELKQLEEMKIIEKSNSPYAFPLLAVMKKDKTLRLCVDFRKLNDITITPSEHMPNPDDMLSKLSQANYFTKIDLSSGYHQIKVKEESKQYTSFLTSEGTYHFNKLPFGLSGAPITFTRLMRQLVEGKQDVVFYLDDMLLYNNTLQQHLTSVNEMFQRIQSFGLTARPKKTFIAHKEIVFLGFVIGNGNLRPESTLVDKIMTIQPPKTKRQLKSLLGLITYYMRFLPHFSTIVSSLTDMTKQSSSNKIVWTQEHNNTLQLIKNLFNQEPILKLPDLSKTFHIFTDASDTAIAGVLTQQYEDIFLPVSYCSRVLTRSQRNYGTAEKEMLAVSFTVDKYRRFLIGKPFYIYTDSKAVAQARYTQSNTNKRILRMTLLMADLHYHIQHIPATQNKLADWLSRLQEPCVNTYNL